MNSKTLDWIFLEINPRVQVEHTVTGSLSTLSPLFVNLTDYLEEISGHDLVRLQLLLFTPTTSLSSLGLSSNPAPPTGFAIQLRLTAEDPLKDFQLSAGKIQPAEVHFPSGRDVRIDTWLTFSSPAPADQEWTIGTDFDSLLAKLIVHAPTFEQANAKALLAMREMVFNSEVKTNRKVLEGVLRHLQWQAGDVDTLWLDRHLKDVIGLSVESGRSVKGLEFPSRRKDTVDDAVGSGGITLIQPGTLFHLSLAQSSSSETLTQETKHTITLSSLFHNAFPQQLSGTLLSSFSPQTPYTFSLSQSNSASTASGDFELANPNDPFHVGTLMTGKIVEIHPALSDDENVESRKVKKGEPVLVLSVMKMETVIPAPRDGWVKRKGKGIKVGVVVGEGMLICVLEETPLSSKL